MKNDAVIDFNEMKMNEYKEILEHNLTQFRISIDSCKSSERVTDDSIIEKLHEMVNQLEHPQFVISNWSDNLHFCDHQNFQENSNIYINL